MIFYSRENGRDGEKDFVDTNDFKDTVFESATLKGFDSSEDIKVNFELGYDEEIEKIQFIATCFIGEHITEIYTIENAYELVEQGAEAYYNNDILDDLEIISKAKKDLLERIRIDAINRDVLLIGQEMDSLGLIVNNENTIGCIDNITIANANTIIAKKHYSIIDLPTISSGTVTIYMTNIKACKFNIESINTNTNGGLVFEVKDKTVETVEDINYIKADNFNTTEEYNENRAQYINIGNTENIEEVFDEFDDLF